MGLADPSTAHYLALYFEVPCQVDKAAVWSDRVQIRNPERHALEQTHQYPAMLQQPSAAALHAICWEFGVIRETPQTQPLLHIRQQPLTISSLYPSPPQHRHRPVAICLLRPRYIQ